MVAASLGGGAVFALLESRNSPPVVAGSDGRDLPEEFLDFVEVNEE